MKLDVFNPGSVVKALSYFAPGYIELEYDTRPTRTPRGRTASLLWVISKKRNEANKGGEGLIISLRLTAIAFSW